MAKLSISGDKHSGICKHTITEQVPDRKGGYTTREVEKTYNITATLQASSTMTSNNKVVLNGDPVTITGCPYCKSGRVQSITSKKITINNKKPICKGDKIEYDGGSITISFGGSKIDV